MQKIKDEIMGLVEDYHQAHQHGTPESKSAATRALREALDEALGMQSLAVQSATASADRIMMRCLFPEPDAVTREQLTAIIEGMSVSVDVSTGDHDAGHRYFGTVTEVMESTGDKHQVTLLVQDAEPNFEPKAVAAQAAPAAVAVPEWDKVRRGLAMVMLGFAGRSDCTESAAEAALDAVTEAGMPLEGLRAALATPALPATGDSSAGDQVEVHPDDAAVDALAAKMKAKLAKQRAKGYGGWDTPECSQLRLSAMLRDHVDKGDPVDVANFCAFLAARGEGIEAAVQAEPTDAEIIALNDGEIFFSMFESRFGKEVNPHTQYHTGEPGYLQFARAVLARWGSATQTQAAVQAEPVTNLTASAIATAVCQRVAELDDRSSPADWPEAMLVTAEELQAILIEELAAALPAPQAQPAFQQRVQPWMMECFGVEHAADHKKRNQHFLEEALELVQSTGWTQSEAHQLVDYVYGRPWGEPAQEVGGVMVTLAALCLANGLDMHQAGESELARIWSNVDSIRARQAAKPSFSPLPQAQPADAPIAYLQESDQHLLHRFIETTEDDESFDIGKDAVKRLANLGVVESCGFGRYGVTMFGYWVHEHYWHQNPSLPLKTNADRDREHRAAMAAAQEGGNAAKEA